jgi:hypothetical protein
VARSFVAPLPQLIAQTLLEQRGRELHRLQCHPALRLARRLPRLALDCSVV